MIIQSIYKCKIGDIIRDTALEENGEIIEGVTFMIIRESNKEEYLADWIENQVHPLYPYYYEISID